MIRVAAVQAASDFLNRDGSVTRACALIRSAGERRADLVVFPESFIPGHPLWLHYWNTNDKRSLAAYERLFSNAVSVPSPSFSAIQAAAREAEVNVVMGITERRPGTTGTLYNSQIFVGRDGSYLGKHQKLVPTVREKIVHAPGGGDTLDTFETDIGRVGGLICGENSNPLASYALFALGEVVHAASWPPFMGFRSIDETVGFVSRALAYTGHVYVINAIGIVDDTYFNLLGDVIEDRAESLRRTGGSCIVDPYGRIIAGPLPNGEEGILVADIDLGHAVRAKLSHDFTGHYNRFDVFELRLKRADQRPLIVEEDSRVAPDTSTPVFRAPDNGGGDAVS